MKLTKLTLVLILSTAFFFMFLISAVSPVTAEPDNIGIRGSSISISAILLQNGTYGDPVSNQVIEFFDQTENSFLGFGTTDNEGIASIVWDIPLNHPLGPTVINATYRGNESLFLAASCQLVTVNILSSTQLLVYYNEELLAPGDFLIFDIILLDDLSSPIQDASVSVFCGSTLLATSITNTSGGVTFTIHCNTTWSLLGENILRVSYEQDLVNYYSKAEELLLVEIQRIETQITFESFSNQLLLDESLNLEIFLSEIKGGISAEIDIVVDEIPLTTIATDSSGTGILVLDIDNRFLLGRHNLQIVYNGSERYIKSVINLEFDVVSYITINCEITKPAIINSNIDLTIQIYDILNRPVDGQLVISDLTGEFSISNQIPSGSTDTKVSFIVKGPVGLHSLWIEIGNNFILNGSKSYTFLAWSRPTIEFKQCNVFHYASPNQELVFLAQFTDWSGNISYRNIQLLLDGQVIFSSLTDQNGVTTLVTKAPINEGTYNYSLICRENLTRYELLARYDYQIIVTLNIPTSISLNYYEIIPPLKEISVNLQVVCLNGSLIEGITVKIGWLSNERFITTQKMGKIVLHLPLPPSSGNYSLYYEIAQGKSLAYSSGFINILVSYISIVAAQGIGIQGFAITLIVSSVIFAIPIIRQRFII